MNAFAGIRPKGGQNPTPLAFFPGVCSGGYLFSSGGPTPTTPPPPIFTLATCTADKTLYFSCSFSLLLFSLEGYCFTRRYAVGLSVVCPCIIYCVHKKQGQGIFSIILFRTGEILYNLEDSFPSLLRAHLQMQFQRNLCNTLSETFYFTDALQN